MKKSGSILELELGQKSHIWQHCKFDPNDHVVIKNQYAKDYIKIQFPPSWLLIAVSFLSIVISIFIESSWARGIGIVLFIVAARTLFEREGEKEGYLLGYRDGWDESLISVTKITEDEEMQIYKTESEIASREN